MSIIKLSELIKLLKKHGYVVGREGGRHTIYCNVKTNDKVAVPRHAKEIPTGTAERILKDCGIKKE